MKRFIWLSLFLIGMISYTGFSSTTDLTKNSDVVLTVDDDVGTVETMVVVSNYVAVINSIQYSSAVEVRTQTLLIPYKEQELIRHNFNYDMNLFEINYEVDKPPINKNNSKLNTKKSSLLTSKNNFIYRAPRDSL